MSVIVMTVVADDGAVIRVLATDGGTFLPACSVCPIAGGGTRGEALDDAVYHRSWHNDELRREHRR